MTISMFLDRTIVWGMTFLGEKTLMFHYRILGLRDIFEMVTSVSFVTLRVSKLETSGMVV